RLRQQRGARVPGQPPEPRLRESFEMIEHAPREMPPGRSALDGIDSEPDESGDEIVVLRPVCFELAQQALIDRRADAVCEIAVGEMRDGPADARHTAVQPEAPRPARDPLDRARECGAAD